MIEMVVSLAILSVVCVAMGSTIMLVGPCVKDILDSAKFSQCGPSTGWKPVPRLAFSDKAQSCIEYKCASAFLCPFIRIYGVV